MLKIFLKYPENLKHNFFSGIKIISIKYMFYAQNKIITIIYYYKSMGIL